MRRPPSLAKLARWAPLAATVSVAVLAIMAWLLARRGDDPAAGLRSLWQDAAWAIPAALGLHLAVQLLAAVRLRMLAQALGSTLRAWRAQQIVTSGLFAAAVTPMRAGAEPLRLALLRRDGWSWGSAGRLLVIDRCFDVAVYLVLGVVAAAVYPILAGGGDFLYVLAWSGLAILVTASACLAALLVWPHLGAIPLARIGGAWERLRRRPPVDRRAMLEDSVRTARARLVDLVRYRPATMVAGLGLTGLMRVSEAAVMFVLLVALGMDVNFFAVMLASVLLVLIAVVPLAPGGAGIVEPAAIVLLTPLAPEVGGAFLVAWRGLTFHVDLVAGACVTPLAMRRRPPAAGEGS